MDRTARAEGRSYALRSRFRWLLGDFPIVGVKWFTAAHYAEAIGRRLMTEFEWEFVATNAGKTLYPWGDDPTQQPKWELRSVSAPTTDTIRKLNVRGLFSNAAELTSSVIAPYPGGKLPPYMAAEIAFGAAYRGGPIDVSQLKDDGTWAGDITYRGSVQDRDSSIRISDSVAPAAFARDS